MQVPGIMIRKMGIEQIIVNLIAKPYVQLVMQRKVGA